MRPPDSAPSGRPPLEAALFEFRQFPGRYALVRREPALLFASIPDVLQLAAGRSRDGLAKHFDSDALREAASFFVRTALLHPDANHYAVLGLTPASEPATIKDRYRLMMRLMHPDFAVDTSRGVWPADAAVRLNLAYEVLSTPGKREHYDEDLAKAAAKPRAQPIQVARPPRVENASPAKKPFEADSRQLLKMLAGGFGAAGAIAVTALVVIGQEAEQGLVQRPRAGSPAAPATSRAGPPPAAAPAFAFEDNLTPAVEPQAQLAVMAPAPTAVAADPPAELPRPAAPTTIAAAIAKFTSPQATLQPSPRPPQVQVVPDSAAPVATAAVVVAPLVQTPPVTQMAPTPAPPPAVAVVAPHPVPAAPPLPPPPLPKSAPAVTMAEAHPLLSRLLQHIEAGNGERILSLLDGESRRSAAAQALLKQYNNLIEGGRPVKIANVDFKAQPGDGRLLVRGNVVLLVGEPQGSSPRKELAVLAEFALRDGAIVMTRLSAPE